MGPTWGPSGADGIQVGPTMDPWALLSGQLFNVSLVTESYSTTPEIPDTSGFVVSDKMEKGDNTIY